MAGRPRPDERFPIVRVPVSPSKWSTWKRYCAAAEISMGRAIVALIDRELAGVAGTAVDDSPVLAQRAREQVAGSEAEVAKTEKSVSAAEERQRGTREQLHRWERELQTLAQRVKQASKPADRCNTTPKVGRNDRCPCGSGLKYKALPRSAGYDTLRGFQIMRMRRGWPVRGRGRALNNVRRGG